MPVGKPGTAHQRLSRSATVNAAAIARLRQIEADLSARRPADHAATAEHVREIVTRFIEDRQIPSPSNTPSDPVERRRHQEGIDRMVAAIAARRSQ
jgi:hypothetical protein